MSDDGNTMTVELTEKSKDAKENKEKTVYYPCQHYEENLRKEVRR